MLDKHHSGSAISFLDRLLPPNKTTRKITFLMFLPIVLAYVARIVIEMILDYDRDTSGLSGLFICCPILCLVGGVTALILGLAVISVRRTHNITPVLVLLGGIVLVPFVPLPPLPQAVFPEEEFFSTYRTEFEQVVILARQNKLECISSYLGCDSAARDLPSGYDHLDTNGHVSVRNKPHLAVTFRPIDFYYPIVYFEDSADRSLFWNSACWDGRWVRKLDEHWYLCVEEWN